MTLTRNRNYANHAKELNNAVPTSPFFFLKPTTCYTALGKDVKVEVAKGVELHHEGASAASLTLIHFSDETNSTSIRSYEINNLPSSRTRSSHRKSRDQHPEERSYEAYRRLLFSDWLHREELTGRGEEEGIAVECCKGVWYLVVSWFSCFSLLFRELVTHSFIIFLWIYSTPIINSIPVLPPRSSPHPHPSSKILKI